MFLPKQGIHITGILHHGHLRARKLSLHIIRNGRQIEHLSSYYDFNKQVYQYKMFFKFL